MKSMKEIVPIKLREKIRILKSYVRYEKNKRLPKSRYRKAIINWYEKRLGKKPNLDNPKTYTEKIQWLKLYDCRPIKGELADKYQMRKYIDAKIGTGHTATLLGVWDSPDEIDFSSLPKKYVLKTTMGSGTNLFMNDPNGGDIARAKKTLKKWLKIDYSFVNGFELHYGFQRNRIIAEEFMDFGIDGATDYKFICSYGRVLSIWVVNGGADHHYHRTILTPDWEDTGVRATHPKHEYLPSRPSSFYLMKEYAELLSQDFSLLRVDMYEYRNKVIVGELTFTPQSGAADFDPQSYDLKLGAEVQLPSEKTQYKGALL